MAGEIDSSDWYQDPTTLLSELKRTHGGGRSRPSIDGYQDLQELRRGGQGVVYTAIQRSTNRRVAVKVLYEDTFDSRTRRRRFEREIDLVSRLQHPHIVRIYDGGISGDGRPFYVMEYIEGLPLNEYLHGAATRSVGARMRLLARICEAVHFAHQHGVIHRDLKPSNIRIDPEGQPHILDFGIAKWTTEAGKMTLTGQILGTLAYASPEQVREDPSLVDVRSDVYSLGVVLYEMLTGRHPHPLSGSMQHMVEAITTQQPPPPSAAGRGGGPLSGDPGLNDEVDTIVLRAMAKDPERRYQSAQALRDDVIRFLEGRPIEAKRDSSWYVLKKTMGRYRAWVAAGAVVLLSIIGFAIFMSVMYRRASDAEQRAHAQAQKAEQINTFLVDMLSSADPQQVGGRDITVREVLDEASKTVDDVLEEQPEARLGVHHAIGTSYKNLGLYEQAEPHLRQVVELQQQLRGPGHTDVASAMQDLGGLLASRGKYAEAVRWLQQALELFRLRLGPDHAHVALGLNNIGGLMLEMGEYDQAESHFREALDINRKLWGAEPHLDKAFSAALLAGLHYRRADYAGAKSLFQEALDMYRELLGDKSPAVAYSAYNLGLSLKALNEYEAAEILLRDALNLRCEVLGPEHPDTMVSASALAQMLRERGRGPEATELMRKVFLGPDQQLSREVRGTLSEMLTKADLLKARGQPQQAQSFYTRVRDVYMAVLGPKHPDTLTTTARLAAATRASGHIQHAAELYEEVLAAARSLWPKDHPDLVEWQNAYDDCRRMLRGAGAEEP